MSMATDTSSSGISLYHRISLYHTRVYNKRALELESMFGMDVWGYMSMNRNLPLRVISEHLDKPWDWNHLSYNINISMAYVLEHVDKLWN